MPAIGPRQPTSKPCRLFKHPTEFIDTGVEHIETVEQFDEVSNHIVGNEASVKVEELAIGRVEAFLLQLSLPLRTIGIG